MSSPSALQCTRSFALLLAIGPLLFAADTPRGNKLFDRVRPWLPAGMEVLYVSNVPLRDWKPAAQVQSPIESYGLLAATGAPFGGTRDPMAKALQQATVMSEVYVAGGTYRLPKPSAGTLGLNGWYDGCTFLDSTPNSVRDVLKAGHANHARRVAGMRLYRIETIGGIGPAVAAALEPDLFMICSSLRLATEIVSRKDAKASAEVFGPQGIEWRWVDKSAPVWGLRVFGNSSLDPTSPHGKSPLTPSYSDPMAEGMTFTLESDTLARVVYITRNEAVRTADYEGLWGLPSELSNDAGHRAISIRFDPRTQPRGRHHMIMLWLLGIMIAT